MSLSLSRFCETYVLCKKEMISGIIRGNVRVNGKRQNFNRGWKSIKSAKEKIGIYIYVNREIVARFGAQGWPCVKIVGLTFALISFVLTGYYIYKHVRTDTTVVDWINDATRRRVRGIASTSCGLCAGFSRLLPCHRYSAVSKTETESCCRRLRSVVRRDRRPLSLGTQVYMPLLLLLDIPSWISFCGRAHIIPVRVIRTHCDAARWWKILARTRGWINVRAGNEERELFLLTTTERTIQPRQTKRRLSTLRDLPAQRCHWFSARPQIEAAKRDTECKTF